jgi:regulatory protein NPR1
VVGGGGLVEKLVSDIESLLQRPDETFSDVIIHVDGKNVQAHRCILVVRCPYFRSLFADLNERDVPKVELKLEKLMKGEKVGYEAFMAVLEYVYGSRMNPLAPSCVSCLDASCPHITCRPAIEFVLEILRASSVLELSELRASAQQHLVNVVGNTQVDDVLLILAAADKHRAAQLHAMCLQVIAHSDLDTLTLEKELSRCTMEEVTGLRLELGFPHLSVDSPQAKQCKRIYRALDLDDVELVQMLLKEEKTDLDSTYALHYAAMYCDPKIMADLLRLKIADTNLRNQRGFTVLHVAALRREPQTIGALLAQGAHLHDVTPDGRTALQICRRLGKKSDGDVDDEYHKDHLSIEILEQAERKGAFSKPTADVLSVPLSCEKELRETLSYLENRVALGRLLFPQQTKIVLGISHLDSTPEFTDLDSPSVSGITSGSSQRQTVDSNQIPSRKQSHGSLNISGDEAKTNVNEALLQRIVALRTTGVVPYCKNSMPTLLPGVPVSCNLCCSENPWNLCRR